MRQINWSGPGLVALAHLMEYRSTSGVRISAQQPSWLYRNMHNSTKTEAPLQPTTASPGRIFISHLISFWQGQQESPAVLARLLILELHSTIHSVRQPGH
jgi:hypothetical protein